MRSRTREVVAAADHFSVEEKYWLELFSTPPVKCSFPVNVRKGDGPVPRLMSCPISFPPETGTRLQKLGGNSDPRIFMILTAGLVALLHRYTDIEDITLGTSIFKQTAAADFVNTVLPLRFEITGKSDFKGLLSQVRQRVLEADAHQNYPIEVLIRKLKIPYSLEDDFPLFDVAVLQENIHDPSYIKNYRRNMTFLFRNHPGGIEGRLEYNAGRFSRLLADQIADHLVRILSEALGNPETALAELEYFSNDEKRRLLVDFNSPGLGTPPECESFKDRSVTERFDDTTAAFPDRTALTWTADGTGDSLNMTYRQLDNEAARVARLLRSRGAGRNEIVGVLAGRTGEMIIGILAVLKAGSAYVAIDPDTPTNRILSMLEDAAVHILLTAPGSIGDHSYTALQELEQCRQYPHFTGERPQIRRLDDLPIPDRSLVDYEKYNRRIGQAMVTHCLSLQATRGCPYECIYCHRIWPKTHAARSAEHLFAEVKLYYRMGIRRFAFIDDVFNLDAANSGRFFRLLIREGLDVQLFFPNGMRGDRLTPDYIDLMVEAGLTGIALALETASPRLQKAIRKNLDLDKLKRNIDYFGQKHPQVITELFTMHGFPTETEAEAAQTMAFIKNVPQVHFPYVFVLKIYPHTRMARWAEEEGISRESIIRSEQLAFHELPDTLPFPKSFSLKYQTEFTEFFLSRERLLPLLPLQMSSLTRDEMLQKYNSYLPVEINDFPELLNFFRITDDEVRGNMEGCLDEARVAVSRLNHQIKDYFTAKDNRQPTPGSDGQSKLRILLLDLSQFFSDRRPMLYDVVDAPLGLMYLLSHLNLQLGDRITGKIAKSGIDFDSFEELKCLLEEFVPQVIGIRTLSFYKNFFHQVVTLIRQWGISVPIIIGGPYATASYRIALADRNIDLAVLGEGEDTFAELVETIIENNARLPGPDQLEKIKGIAFQRETEPGSPRSRDLVFLETGSSDILPGPAVSNKPDDLAYVIFTSGSTGRPKGVMIEHRNLNNLVYGLNERIYRFLSGPLKVALLSPFMFDASIKQIFGSLLLGHNLCIVPHSTILDSDALVEYYNKHRVDLSDGTPNHLRIIMASNDEGSGTLAVKRFLVGGEALPAELVTAFYRRFRKQGEEGLRIVNVYGPSECSVDSTSFSPEHAEFPAEGIVPIGKPMPNVKVYVTSADFRLQPIGVAGELLIGGDGVGRGYLKEEGLTAEKFITDPFNGDRRVYCSGDRVRWLFDGNLEFLGRLDNQVKIRGYRIEPEEVEKKIQAHPLVKEAVVVADQHTGDSGFKEMIDRYLCAYLAVDGPVADTEIREFLKQQLPDYMIPTYFIFLDSIPRNRSGKVDRASLPAPSANNFKRPALVSPPRNPVDNRLREIWSEVLGIEESHIGIDADFFELGGHSLRALVVVSRIHKELNVKSSIADLFNTPTIRGLSDSIKGKIKETFVAVNPTEEMEYYPLSSAQRRLFMLQKMELVGTAYNLPQFIPLGGDFDSERIEEVFCRLIQRHESFRTSFPMIDDEPVQVIHKDVDFLITRRRLDDVLKVEELMADFIRPFDLSIAPLLRVGLLERKDQDSILMVDMHHIIADGVSHGILKQDFWSLYQCRELPSLHLRYRDYTCWQNRGRLTGRLKIQEKYWLDEFSEPAPATDLPTDFPRPAVQSFEGDRILFTLGPEISSGLSSLGTAQDATLFMIICAAVDILIAKLSGQEDVTIGTALSGRSHADLQQIVGMMVNILPVRSSPLPDKSIDVFTSEVRQKLLKVFDNQDYQFADLVEKVQPVRDMSRNPLFDIVFAYQAPDESGEIPPDFESPAAGRKGFLISKFDLTISCTEFGDDILFSLEYCTRLFKEETIQRFRRFLCRIMQWMTDRSNSRIGDIEIISPEEKEQVLVKFNDTRTVYPADRTIQQLFLDQVEKNSNRDAAILIIKSEKGPETGEVMSYGKLNRKADLLAHWLFRKGTGAHELVGIEIERSIAMLVAILGVLKVGGAYLPIDPDFPEKRREYILRDANVDISLTRQMVEEALAEPSSKPEIPGRNESARDVAYVMYTSGSTGTPKGVLVEHRSVIRLVKGADYVDLSEKTRLLQTGAPVFDATTFEIWGPLLNGGILFLAVKEMILDVRLLDAVLSGFNINTMWLTSPLFNQLMTEDIEIFAPLEYLLVGGDVLSPRHISGIRIRYPDLHIVNGYGPTENTTFSATYSVEREFRESIPIGKPIANSTAYILDAGEKPVPVGIVGELFVGGDGVSRGYLNSPTQTSARFGLDPYSAGNRLYRTGDQTRWRSDGNIDFLGRSDSQVKVRGFRIEPGEIASQLEKHRQVMDAVIVAHKDNIGNAVLSAYIIPTDGENPDVSSITDFLGQRVPDYMVPAHFVFVPEFPLTSNGKLDHRALTSMAPLPGQRESEYIAPRSDVEKELARVWSAVLGRTSISINDNFFHIGGDSIKSIQIVSRMKEAGYRLEVQDLFEKPTIGEVAPWISRETHMVDQSPVTGRIPLTPIQSAFFLNLPPNPNHYNQAMMFYSREELDEGTMRTVFRRIQEHHDALRMTFKRKSGEVEQWNHGPDYPLSLVVYDWRNLELESARKELEIGVNEVQTGLDLERGPVMKTGLFHLPDGDRLLIVIHHLVVDGVSWRILLEDIEALYRHYTRDSKSESSGTLELPQKTDSFKRWAELLNRYADSPELLKEKLFWKELESRMIPVIPRDHPAGRNDRRGIEKVSIRLTEEETERLLTKVHRAFGTEINDILLTALGLSFKKTFSVDYLLLALEGHGRETPGEDIDIERTVGWYTSLYPVVLDFSGPDDLARRLKEIKETLRRIPRKGIGYGVLKHLTSEENKEDVRFSLKPQVSFNYLGQFDGDLEFTSFGIAPESAGDMQDPDGERDYDIDISGLVADKSLVLTVLYNGRHFNKKTIAALADRLQEELRGIIDFCFNRKIREYTPFDFTYPHLSIDTVDEICALYPVEDIYTLTPLQEGLLFHSFYEKELHGEDAFAYFEQMSFRLKGSFDPGMVRESLVELTRRHDVLRSRFFYSEGLERPLQVVLTESQVDFKWMDVQSRLQENQVDINRLLDNWKLEDRRRSFDLCRDPLMRVTLLRMGEGEFNFIWSHHHIVMDGWCLGILISEFLEIYSALAARRPIKLAPVTPFRDYIRWLEKRDRESPRDYWRRLLDQYETAAVIPKNSLSRGGAAKYRMEHYTFRLDREIIDRLNRLAGKNQATLNSAFQAIWGIQLAKYCNTDDVVFGSVVSGRPGEIAGIEKMIGLFINTVPVRVRFDSRERFRPFMRRVQKRAIESEPFHYFPLAEIQAGSILRQNLFDHIVVFENYPVVERLGKGYTTEEDRDRGMVGWELLDFSTHGQTHYDFNILINQGEEWVIKIRYNAEAFDKSFIDLVTCHFRGLLNQILENSDKQIKNLTILSIAEKHRILQDFNAAPSVRYRDNGLLPLWFDKAVDKWPHRTALIHHSHVMTYLELDNLSRGLARLLSANGAGPDRVVAVMLERSIDLMICLFAILKTGGAYLPIEPATPTRRVRYYMVDSCSPCLLTRRDYGDPDLEKVCASVFIEDYLHNCAEPDIQSISGNVDPLSMAYALYTSGSTGRPKGVLVKHGSVAAILSALYRMYPFGERDVYLFKTPYVFDVSVSEIFGWIFGGGRLVVLESDGEKDPGKILDAIRRYRVSHVNFVPSMFAAFLDRLDQEEGPSLADLRYIFLAGEALPPEQVVRFKQLDTRIRLENIYGPTEATIYSSVYSLQEWRKSDGVPIGKPLERVRLYILDRYDELQPIGIPGELCIAGVGVTCGYLNNPELTWEKFSPDPFEPNRMMYRTGDLARWIPDGNIDFRGRIDTQVKIRGFRIELMEIENHLLDFSGVKEVVVIGRGERDQYLCAYVVGPEQLVIGEIRRHLSSRLPGYMIPAYFVILDKLPLLQSGKIDRAALPAPRIRPDDHYTAPRTRIEKKLVRIWSHLLQVEGDAIGIHSHFFELGGHSLKTIDMVSQIHREFDIKIPLNTVFRLPTVSQLAGYIEMAMKEVFSPIYPVEKMEFYALSAAQNRMYFLHFKDPSRIGFNMSAVKVIESAVNRHLLEEVFRKLIDRHEILRSSFFLLDDTPVQRVHGRVSFEIDYFDLRLGGNETDIVNSFLRLFDLERPPLLRVGLIKCELEKYILMLEMHHITTDFVSSEILINDFSALYSGEVLSPLSIQYKDFAEWQNRLFQSGEIEKQQSYWLRKFETEVPVLNLPLDFPRPEIQNFEGDMVSFELAGDLSRRIQDFKESRDVTLYMLLLTILNVLLSRLSGQDDIVVGTPTAGRRHDNLRPLIGMFVNTLAMRSAPQRDKSFERFLEEVKENTLEAFENQDFQIEELMMKVTWKRDIRRNPLFDVVLNVMAGDRTGPGDLPEESGIKIKPYQIRHRIARFDMYIEAREVAGSLWFMIEYCRKLFRKETVELFGQYLENVISAVLDDPAVKLGEIDIFAGGEKDELLSDFNVDLENE